MVLIGSVLTSSGQLHLSDALVDLQFSARLARQLEVY